MLLPKDPGNTPLPPTPKVDEENKEVKTESFQSVDRYEAYSIINEPSQLVSPIM